jgi:hypothetical protein
VRGRDMRGKQFKKKKKQIIIYIWGRDISERERYEGKKNKK